MSLWFRAYSETLNDPKVQTLPLASFKAWHNCLYLAAGMGSKTGNIGTLETIAFAFRETEESVSSAFHPLVSVGLLVTESETFRIVSWQKRQYKSDTSTERVKQFRKRSRNVTETAPDTETEQKGSVDKSTDVFTSPDPTKVLFDAGVRLLISAGKSKAAAASIIGKWRKSYSDEAILSALGRAQREGAIEPVAFIEKALQWAAKNSDQQSEDEPSDGTEKIGADGQLLRFSTPRHRWERQG